MKETKAATQQFGEAWAEGRLTLEQANLGFFGRECFAEAWNPAIAAFDDVLVHAGS